MLVVVVCMYKSGFIVVTAQSTYYNTERHLNKYFLHCTKFQNKSFITLRCLSDQYEPKVMSWRAGAELEGRA